MAFVERRVAAPFRPDGTSVPRPVNTGIGMGGPTKPFLWRLGFGQVVQAIAAATAAPAPAFVDDLSSL
eukprot:7329874-Alexandrium_andersonii.AAC.1